METKLDYLLDSGTTLNMLEIPNIEIKNFRKIGICFQKYPVNIEPTQHCCIGNDIFLRLLEKQKAS